MNESQKNEAPLLFGLLVKKFNTDGKPYVHFNWGKNYFTFRLMIAFMWISTATLLFAYFKYVKDFDTVKFLKYDFAPV